jgi:hypothetical protein
MLTQSTPRWYRSLSSGSMLGLQTVTFTPLP